MAKLIGTNPNQVPTNADLGTLAFQDSEFPSLGNLRLTGSMIIGNENTDTTQASGVVSRNLSLPSGSSGDLFLFGPSPEIGFLDANAKRSSALGGNDGRIDFFSYSGPDNSAQAAVVDGTVKATSPSNLMIQMTRVELDSNGAYSSGGNLDIKLGNLYLTNSNPLVGIGTNDPKRPLQIGATGSFPISFNGNYPDIHMNTYYESGWRIHTAGFGAKTTFNGATGAFGFSNVASTQVAGATFTPQERLTILANGNITHYNETNFGSSVNVASTGELTGCPFTHVRLARIYGSPYNDRFEARLVTSGLNAGQKYVHLITQASGSSHVKLKMFSQRSGSEYMMGASQFEFRWYSESDGDFRQWDVSGFENVGHYANGFEINGMPYGFLVDYDTNLNTTSETARQSGSNDWGYAVVRIPVNFFSNSAGTDEIYFTIDEHAQSSNSWWVGIV